MLPSLSSLINSIKKDPHPKTPIKMQDQLHEEMQKTQVFPKQNLVPHLNVIESAHSLNRQSTR